MKIGVVIPCRNERLYIAECIHAIFACHLPNDTAISVFVVDGMSDDGTRDVVIQLQKTYPSLVLVDNQKQLTPFAFNAGIFAAGNVDFIQIVGARHVLSSNYISKALEILKSNSDIWCVGGKIENEFINNTGEIISKVMGTTLGMGIGNFRTLEKSGFTDTVTSPMYPSWVFEKIGYFDEDLIRNQDDDFNYRVTSAGGKIFFDAEIALKYYVRGNFKNLWRQFFQYGYWKVFVNRKHKAVTTLRQVVPPLFVLYLVLLLGNLFVLNVPFFAIPLALYVLLVVGFSAKILVANPALNSFGILISFPIVHIGYGLGYLIGIMDFLIRNKKPSNKQKRLSR
jgi:GT2 family glycosyltransferase